MNSNKDRLTFLLKAYTEHTISVKDLEELSAYISKEEQDPALQELMQEFWINMEPDHNLVIPKGNIYQSITGNPLFKADLSPKPLIKPVYRWRAAYLYAASLLFVLACGLVFYKYAVKDNVSASQFAKNDKPSNEIKPGVKKAVLTLADGSRLVLEDAVKKTLAVQNGASVEQNGGQLIYHADKNTADTHVMLRNSINTPRGGEYQLHLEDGTVVWLNSASSITYPVAFNGKERRVSISGEAYFEVAKNPHLPFIVEANGTEVKVLGTHFNVNAYADNDAVKTTLVEGAVEVSKNGQRALLKPDQQAIAGYGSNQIQVIKVDAMEALAWKNGIFLFNNLNIKLVMKEISRWYDIEVVYRGDVTHKTFGGTISRFENFEQLLKTLELTGAIHFKIEGRRVIVMP